MDKPDAALEIKRDDSGRVTGLECKVSRSGNERMGEIEGMEMVTRAIDAIFASEGPEDHTTQVDVHVDLSLMSD